MKMLSTHVYVYPARGVEVRGKRCVRGAGMQDKKRV